MRNIRIILVGLLVSSMCMLTACNSSQEREIIHNEYYDAIEKIHPLFKLIANKTKGTSVSYDGYRNTMKHSLPEIEKVLLTYKKSVWSETETYKTCVELVKNYTEAQIFWKEKKGLFLVHGRFDRGRELIQDLEAAFDKETARKLFTGKEK